jgi:hypothetical protein
MFIITAHPDRLCEPGFTDCTLYDDGKEELTVLDAERAYQYWLFEQHNDRRWPEAEKVIAQDAEYAYRYAEKFYMGRWPEAEKVIAQNAKLAYWYARDIIEDRFPEGEAAIEADPKFRAKYTHMLDKWRILDDRVYAWLVSQSNDGIISKKRLHTRIRQRFHLFPGEAACLARLYRTGRISDPSRAGGDTIRLEGITMPGLRLQSKCSS